MTPRLASTAVVLLLLAVPLAGTVLDEPWLITLATRVAILGMAGVGLNLVLGYGGMVSLGHAAYFGIGGYVAGILAHHALEGHPLMAWPVALGSTDSMIVIWLAAIVCGALLALLIGCLSLRTTGVYFIMITLAFAQMIYYFTISWPAYGGEDGLPIYLRNSLFGLDTMDPMTFFLIVFAASLSSSFWSPGSCNPGPAWRSMLSDRTRPASAVWASVVFAYAWWPSSCRAPSRRLPARSSSTSIVSSVRPC